MRGYDYTQAGAYFVTIVTHNREPLLGDVVDGEMALNAYGRVAATMWQRVPRHFPHVQLDEWIVMPIWQRNYHERIIRNEQELNAIRQYIYDNPAHWLNDAENPVTARQD